MRSRAVALCLIVLLGMLTVLSIPVTGAHEKTWPGKKLASMFPKAEKFVAKKAVLTPEKVASIEKEIGTKLRSEDLKPTFYIALNEKKKPMGLVLFVDVKGPHRVIDGGVGLDMNGKVVKVEVYKHKEAAGISDDKFLKQFIGKGIEDKFQIGQDVQSVVDQEQASQAVALMPKKMLAMSYALFLKRKGKPKAEARTDPDHEQSHAHGHEVDEIEDLKALMHLMHEPYIRIREYFKNGENQPDAVKAAKRLGEYAKLIPHFVPPKNPNNEEEYVYLQKKAHDALHEFAETLEKEGISEKTQKQWQDIIDLVNKAHLRFSVEEVDLDEDADEPENPCGA